MRQIEEVIARIGPLDEGAMERARQRLDRLTKPPGSLGRLEDLAVWLAGVTGRPRPRLERKAVIVMAGDHGVAREGVSAYPPEVTGQMVMNFLRGGAAINVLARLAGARVVVVDMGVASPLPPHPGLLSRRVAPGTKDLAQEPAMTREEAERAVLTGIQVVEAEVEKGLDLVALGDMGIANTTPSSAIVSALTGRPPAEVTGRGTGVDREGWLRKVAVVERALALHRPDPSDPWEVLHTVGGFEIGGLAGVALGAASHRVPVVVDGFIAGAAVLLATALCPGVRDYLVAGHLSAEPGHRAALAHLGLTPLLDLGLRLGEGTGAVLAFPLLEAAARLLDEMATFEDAGVSGPVHPVERREG